MNISDIYIICTVVYHVYCHNTTCATRLYMTDRVTVHCNKCMGHTKGRSPKGLHTFIRLVTGFGISLLGNSIHISKGTYAIQKHPMTRIN